MSKKDDFSTANQESSDFLVIDNLVEFFGSDDVLSEDGLTRCRAEAENLASAG